MLLSPDDGPHTRTGGRPGRAVVWVLGMVWLALQALGRAGLWLLATVDAATSAVARGGGRAVRAAVRALGPVGRGLLWCLAPVVRGVRRAWAWLNRRVLRGMARGLGRCGRWLVQRTRPAVRAVRAWGRRTVARAAPLVHRLGSVTAAVERSAARLGRAPVRVLAPALRVTAALRRQARSLAARVRAR